MDDIHIVILRYNWNEHESVRLENVKRSLETSPKSKSVFCSCAKKTKSCNWCSNRALKHGHALSNRILGFENEKEKKSFFENRFWTVQQNDCSTPLELNW